MAETQAGSAERTARIRALNDALRRGACANGQIVVTSGVHERGEAFVARVVEAVTQFDAFTPDNDPHLEHDFGGFDVDGEKLFFKVDYYDLAMTAHSQDAADPAVTKRVLTIMMASEY